MSWKFLHTALCLLVVLGAAEFVPASLASAAQASSREDAGSIPVLAGDKSFRLSVPAGWKKSEARTSGDFSLELLAPGEAMLDYSLLRVQHIFAPHRTGARFAADLARPRGGDGADKTEVIETTIAGQRALLVERVTGRSLFVQPETVPCRIRVIVLPQRSGFFALTAEVPLAQEGRRGEEVQRMLKSFQPLAKNVALPPSVGAVEEELYAAFMNGAAETAGQSVPYLREASKVRAVYARTTQGRALTPELDTFFAKECGGLPQSLREDYNRKRTEQVLITDHLPVENLRLRIGADDGTEPDFLGSASLRNPEIAARLAPGAFRRGEALKFSRAGISSDGTSALFYVTNFETSPGTSYMLLMQRSSGAWTLRCAALLDMRIY